MKFKLTLFRDHRLLFIPLTPNIAKIDNKIIADNINTITPPLVKKDEKVKLSKEPSAIKSVTMVGKVFTAIEINIDRPTKRDIRANGSDNAFIPVPLLTI